MNPKFRDLQIQAFAECKTFEDRQFRTDEVFEKFAELIVRECADIAQQHNKSPIGAPLAVGYVIREHFGVEE